MTGNTHLHTLYQGWSDRMAANPEMGLDDMRSLFEEWHLPTAEPEGVTYAEDEIGGVGGMWALPLDADAAKVIVYTHGGGFAVGSAASHRKLAGHLAKALGARAFVVEYRRSPENPFPAQLEDNVAVYRAMLADKGIDAANVTLAGDSAGGNLALATALKLKDDGDALPGAVVAFSPWLDMEHNGATLESNAEVDKLISRPIVEGMSGMFLGGSDADRTNPLANPLYGDYAGFPRLYITVGDEEALLDNAERLEAAATAAGVDVTLSVGKGQQHVYPFLAGNSPVADAELSSVATWRNV